MGIVFEPITDTEVKTTSYQKNKTHFKNKPFIVGIVFEPIKDTEVKTTLYPKNKNHFNNKPLIVGGYSIWAY